MSNIRAKSVVKYVVMPGIIPRAKALFTSGFSWIAFLIAQIYAMVKLLPPNHPYLNPENRGKFNIRHAIAAAANNLVLKKDNWDQIIVFAAIITGVVILFAQIFLLIFSLIFEPVFAQTTFSGSIFATPGPSSGGVSKDIAFTLLDRIFGVPDFFCATGGVCTEVNATLPWPFHTALHQMFAFYSTGLLIIAVLIVLYFIVILVVETATSGTPFGERFKNVWVPVRLVVALALLTPVHYGLNSAQFITLFAAKTGSSLATNGWHRFNNTIKDNSSDKDRANPTGETNTLLAAPITPSIAPTVQAMSLVHGCAYGEWKTAGKIESGKYIYKKGTEPPNPDFFVKPYMVKPGMLGVNTVEEITSGTSYKEAIEFFKNGDIKIVFGRAIVSTHPDSGSYIGGVEPLCGEVKIGISDVSYIDDGDIDKYGGGPMVQRFYFNLIKQIWFNEAVSSPAAAAAAAATAAAISPILGPAIGVGAGAASILPTTGGDHNLLIEISQRFMELNVQGAKSYRCSTGNRAPIVTSTSNCEEEYPTGASLNKASEYYQSVLDDTINEAWELYNENGIEIKMKPELFDYGWAGAGIWYNKISQINGSFVSAVFDTPSMITYPDLMEKLRKRKAELDPNVQGVEQFNPTTSKAEDIADILPPGDSVSKAKGLYEIINGWNKNSVSSTNQDKEATQNPFIDGMNLIFGTSGLFAMRGKNAKMHPLAQLSALGKGIINSAVFAVLGATVTSVLGGAQVAGGAFVAVTSVLKAIAFVGLTAGIVLYYILPLLPFIYFFFAVGNWIKGLFEAMVGVPLWALAHLRLDGEGLPGQAAESGYFLILETMIRPILIVFGLISATLIFTAQVRILNFIWDLVIQNLGAYESTVALSEGMKFELSRGIVDQFFFTVMYTIIVYLMASASFKLIDSIPNNIMRFAGSGVTAFGDSVANDAEKIQGMASKGGLTQGQQLVGAVTNAGSGVGGIFGQMKAQKDAERKAAKEQKK